MGLINLEQLLSPIHDTDPSGPNLEYEPPFREVERLAEGKPEQRIGDVHVPAEPPDWSVVVERSHALLERTHDLRLAVLLARALLHRNGYQGFAEGLACIAGLLREFWATLHPELDHEDNDDPTMRITALMGLCSPPTLLTLRLTPLVQVRGLSPVSLQDIQALVGGHAGTGNASSAADAATVEAAFQEVEFGALESVEAAVQDCITAVAAIDASFEDHTGSHGPDLAPLMSVLREVRHVLTPRVQARRAALPGGDGADPGGTEVVDSNSGAEPARRAALTGEIASRDDVVRAIDKICAYYARYEPASPIPLLLERCKRLVPCSFLEIIQDLAPDSVAQVTSLAGRKLE